jgi:riboflavin kinase/FMN adenylyltransferase
MIVHRIKDSFPDRIGPAVVTLGNFDGVHVGHQELLRQTREIAQAIGGVSVAVTFNPHPVRMFKPGTFRLIQPIEDRIKRFEQEGVDVAVVLEFNRKLADHGAQEFVEKYLLELFDLKHIVIGFNTTFGKGRTGDPLLMTELGKRYGFETTVVPAIFQGEAPISSSRIRHAVADGHVRDAERLLGYPFSLTGTVIKGYGRGSSILDMPTANLQTSNDLIPAQGVYATWVYRGDKRYMGALSIGTNPTFNNSDVSIEVYLLDFEGHLYGEQLKVEFVKRLRRNQRFNGIEELKQQLSADVAEVRRVLA